MSVSGIGVLYFLIIVVANAVGSVSGMGGGVIIKPVLDFVGHDSVVAISFYSTVAVFTMSLVVTGSPFDHLNFGLILYVTVFSSGLTVTFIGVSSLSNTNVKSGFVGKAPFIVYCINHCLSHLNKEIH